MKNKRNLVIFAVLLSICSLALVAFSISMAGTGGALEEQATRELRVSLNTQAEYLAHAVELQYEPLEAMAAYFASKETLDYEAESELSAAFAHANVLLALGLANAQGDAMDYTGMELDNVADFTFFKNTTYWKGQRAAEYLPAGTLLESECIVLSVPVIRQNAVEGVLFACFDIATFNVLLLADYFEGKAEILLTDAAGRIIAVREGEGTREKGETIAEYYPELLDGATVEGILSSMRNRRSGSFASQQNEKEFAYFLPVEIGEWYLFASVPRSAVGQKNLISQKRMAQTLLFLAFAFLVAVAFIIISTGYYSRKAEKDGEELRRQIERFETIMNELDSAIYEWSAETRTLFISEAIVRMLGYMLPPDWISDIPNRRNEHPEFDYPALLETRNRVELTGVNEDVELCITNKHGEIVWVSITMAPLYNRRGQLISIYGTVTDVTSQREEKRLLNIEFERLYTALLTLVPTVVSINLTKNSYTLINHERYARLRMQESGVYDDMLAQTLPSIIEEDRQKFADTFSRETLLRLFEAGEKQAALEHRRIGEDGEVHWIRTTIIRVPNRIDDDVLEISFSRNIDDQKLHEAQLQREYDLTIENMPNYVGKWLFDGEDVLLIDANRKYLDFMGVSAEDAFNRSIIYHFSKEEKRQIIARLYERERERQSISFISPSRKATGEERWLRVQASFFEEQDGRSVYFGTLTDITELMLSQQRLEESVNSLKQANDQLAAHAAYNRLFDESQNGGTMIRSVWRTKPFTVQYISPGLLKMLGLTEEEFLTIAGDEKWLLIYPDDVPTVKSLYNGAANVGDRFSIDYRFRHSDGHVVWVSENAQVVEMPDKTPTLASIFVDISARKEQEQALRIGREEYKLAASLSAYTVLRYDIAEKRMTLLSQGKSKIQFAKTMDNVPEAAIESGAIAPESVDKLLEIFAAMQRGEPEGKEILVLQDKKNNKYWVEMRFSSILDDSGVPATAIVSFADRTDQRHAADMFNVNQAFMEYNKDVRKLMILNLTTGIVEYETSGPHGILADKVSSDTLADIVQYVLPRMVFSKDADICETFFDTKRMLAAYEAGSIEETLDYRGLDESGAVRWLNVRTRMLSDDYTNDIKAYIIFMDIHEQKLTELSLSRTNKRDAVTGFMNREGFIEELRFRAANSKIKNRVSAIAVISVDMQPSGSEEVVPATDAVMQLAAAQLRRALCDNELVSRYDNNLFAVLLPRLSSEELLHKRCMTICDFLLDVKAEDSVITSNMGISTFPIDGRDGDTLLQKAEIALQQAQAAGKNRSAHYNAQGPQPLLVEGAMRQEEQVRKIFVRTFGFFDIFVDGKPVHFTNAKEKELLAILIDRNGGTLTSEDAVSILWEDEPCGEKQLTRYRKVAMRLRNTLQEAGIEDILVVNHGIRSIDTAKIECDYYKFLQGDPAFRKLFHDAYMSNYSWAEETLGALMHMSGNNE